MKIIRDDAVIIKYDDPNPTHPADLEHAVMDAHGVLLGTTKEGYLVAAFPNLRYAAAFLTSHDFGNLDDALVTEPTTIPGHPPLRRG